MIFVLGVGSVFVERHETGAETIDVEFGRSIGGFPGRKREHPEGVTEQKKKKAVKNAYNKNHSANGERVGQTVRRG